MPSWPERLLAALVPWVLTLVAEWAYGMLWVLLGALLIGWEAAVPAVLPTGMLLAALLATGLAWESALGDRLLRRERQRALARGAFALLALAGGALIAGLTAATDNSVRVGGALAAWYGVYQGLRLGQEGIDHDRLARRFGFQAPLLVLVLLTVLAAGGVGQPAVAGAAGFALAGYFGAALAGLALARQREAINRQREAGQEPVPALTPGTAALLALTVLALGLLTSGAAGAALASRAWTAAGDLLWLAFALVLRLVWLIAYRIAMLVLLLISLIRLRLADFKLEPLVLGDSMAEELQLLGMDPSVAGRAVGWVAGLLALATLVLTLFYLQRRRRRQRPGRTGEMRESIFTWHLLADDLRSFLASLLGRLRRPAAAPAAAPPRAESAAGGALDLRAVYRRLQRLGAHLGWPRRPGQTPRQYRGTLAALLPGGDRHVALITAAYERLRYGPEAPGEAEVAAARLALQELEAPSADSPAADKSDPGFVK